MKRIGFVFLLFIIQVGAYAQDYHVVDSIKQLLKQQQVQDTNTVMRYLYLGGEYVWSVPDTAIYYDNKALSLSRQLHFTHGEFFALVNRAYPLAVVREDSTAVASAYGAISMAEALKNKQYIVYAYSALGTVYLHLKEFDKGILYHRKALAYESTVNPYFLQSYNEHLAQCFLGLNRPDSALYYVNKALEDDKQIQYSSGFDWYLIGNIYLQKGLPDSALRYYREGLAMVTEKRVFKDMADCNLGIANVFLQKNKFDSAIYYAKNGWIVASKTRLPNEKLDALNLLTSLFASQKKIDSAYKYQQYATLLKDSIYNAAKVRQVQLLAFNDDLRKLQDAETARKRLNANIIIALVALLLFAFTIVAIIYNHNKKRKKAYALLQKQKEEIDNKNKELEMESALEKVRSRSLAMRQSDELQEVVRVVFEQLQHLGISFDFASIDLYHEDAKDFDSYSCGWAGNEFLTSNRYITYFDHPIMNDIIEAREKGIDFHVKTYTKEEINSALQYAFEHTELKEQPDDVKAQMLANKGYTIARAFGKNCAVNINNWSAQEITDSEKNILIRFAKVFEQAYTRFLDLQRAEAQAREAQVEAALERVRSRSLAMHHSNELQDVVGVMYEQLTKLGFNKNEDVVSICLFDDDTGEMPSWAAGNDGAVPFCLITPKNEYAIYTNIWKARANGEDFLSKVYSREEKNAFWGYLFAQNNYAQLPQKDKDDVMQGEGYAYDIAIAKHACIMYLNFHGRLTLNDEQKEILKRFVNVFEQAYIRFLDLQRAEAQAREAHIEAALERVRSRSMGMQKSEELREVIQLILDQLLGLHFPIDAATITVEFNESNDARVWLAAPGQQYATRIDVPYIDHPIFNRTVEAKEKGETFYTLLLTKEEKNRYFDHFFKYAPVTEERRKWLYSSAGWVMSAVLMNTVALTIYNYSAIPYSEEQNKTLIRFGNVFQQTYTRFLDLQRAEAQAREAQIEAALERVRSRSMGMQKSEELREVIQVIFDQLCSLHINLDFASFAVEIDKTNDLRNWVASPLSQYATRIDIPYIDHPLFNRLIEAKEKGEAFITLQLNQEEKDRFFDHYFQFAAATEERKSYVFKSKSWVLSIVVMRSLMLTMANYSGTPFSDEENKTLMRFGKAFEQTYTRFLDLQKAEAAAREAVKQASIDRVRAEIASMRTTKDLDRIIPLIWNELTLLHIPFIRCGVFIVNEDAQQTQVYLSTPEGKAIAAFQLPFNSEGLNKNMLEHWRNNQLFIDHWDAERFSEWTHSLVAAGAIQPNERYSHEQPPENLYLHFIPFMQGMLYVGNTAPLSEEELSLIESLADAFSTAYARYEDFSKLEAAKQQIETTLTELKSTQSQLIQKEKMASLGELTAGIAHEIQNPLNFVNNFSEINTELMEELKEERIKKNGERDEQLEKDLLEDIEQNLQKILHHGKRADSIVKGMLQHSRASSGKKEWVHLNALVDEYLRLSYHGLRAKDKSFNTDFTTHFDESIDKVNVIPQDISRVLLNLFNNAFYAVNERKKQLNGAYEPVVSVVTKKLEGKVEITVSDNGNGIPLTIINKIFQPFFTTKPTGQGTGLGLSLSYDIIKAHGGELKVESKEGEGSTFIIQL